MTTILQVNTTTRVEGTLGARSAPRASVGAPGTRSFDEVFGETIGEQPEHAEVEDRTDAARASDEPEKSDRAEDDTATEAPREHEGATKETETPREHEDAAKADEIGADVAPDAIKPDHPGEKAGPSEGKPPRSVVSAEGVRHEITHAADVDVAALNARELASRTPKQDEAERLHDRPPPGLSRGHGGGGSSGGGTPTAPVDAAPKGQAAPVQARPADAPTNDANPPRANVSATNAQPTATPVAAPGASAPAPQSGGNVTPTASTGAASVGAVGAAGAPGTAGTGTGSTGSNGSAAGDVLTRLSTLGASASRATEKPEGGANTPRQGVLAQVQRGLAQVLKQGGGTVNLRLNPRSLGEVKVELTVKDGVATAKFQASSESARRLLNDNLTTLREALEAKGVRVESLSVEVRPGERPTESASGHRTGTDAGPNHEGDGSPEGFDARSETGAEGGMRGDAHTAREALAARAGIRAGLAGDAEHPEDAQLAGDLAAPDQAGTPRVVRIGLDTIA